MRETEVYWNFWMEKTQVSISKTKQTENGSLSLRRFVCPDELPEVFTLSTLFKMESESISRTELRTPYSSNTIETTNYNWKHCLQSSHSRLAWSETTKGTKQSNALSFAFQSLKATLLFLFKSLSTIDTVTSFPSFPPSGNSLSDCHQSHHHLHRHRRIDQAKPKEKPR